MTKCKQIDVTKVWNKKKENMWHNSISLKIRKDYTEFRAEGKSEIVQQDKQRKKFFRDRMDKMCKWNW